MSAVVAELEYMRKQKRSTRKEALKGGGLVRVPDDLERYFSEALLEEITILYQRFYSVREIAAAVDRDPDEVFVALFHQARNGKLKRKYEYRESRETSMEVKVIKVKKDVPTVLEIDGMRYVHEPDTKWR